MKPRQTALVLFAASALLAGCATTDEPLSQKEQDRMKREMDKANRKELQNQNKTLRDTNTQRRTRF